MKLSILLASPVMAHDIAAMAGELLDEITTLIGVPAFNYDAGSAEHQLRVWIARETYHVLAAIDQDDGDRLLGFASMYESAACYAGGTFGTIQEFYVRPQNRRNGVGKALLQMAKLFGHRRRWTRFEVTTPPIPEFAKTLAFYEREGFAVTGGRKMKLGL